MPRFVSFNQVTRRPALTWMSWRTALVVCPCLLLGSVRMRERMHSMSEWVVSERYADGTCGCMMLMTWLLLSTSRVVAHRRLCSRIRSPRWSWTTSPTPPTLDWSSSRRAPPTPSATSETWTSPRATWHGCHEAIHSFLYIYSSPYPSVWQFSISMNWLLHQLAWPRIQKQQHNQATERLRSGALDTSWLPA